MAGENLNIARRAWSALDRRDLDDFLALIDQQVEFTSLIAEAEGTSYQGHQGVRDWWEKVAGAFGGLQWEVQELQEVGPGVVSKITVTGSVGGVDVPQTMWHCSRLRNGKVVWWGAFRTEEEAIEALQSAV
jgi:ketosteroid isomerase-like protein